jgi:hypothetical protein
MMAKKIVAATAKFDAVASKELPTVDLIDSYCRPFTDEEYKASVKRFGGGRPRDRWVTTLVGNHPQGGWPEMLARDSVVLAHHVFIRAYVKSPEMVPDDFEWTQIEEGLWGGTLKDAAKRT